METKIDQPPQGGIITKQFTVWCAICGDWEMQSSGNLDMFCNTIMKENWRLAIDHGWVHKKCCRMTPAYLKFKL